jgi:hypothetical protein
MAFMALFDACVLRPWPLRDLLVSLATTELFRARWTERIQDEWTRSLEHDEPDRAAALQRTRANMALAVPDATVTGYEALIPTLTLPDPDDHHVLAAAIIGRVDVIVTLNLKDFPAERLTPFGIHAQHPDEFVAHVLTLSPTDALTAIKEMRARLKNPPFDPEAFLALLLRQGLPLTVAILRKSAALI